MTILSQLYFLPGVFGGLSYNRRRIDGVFCEHAGQTTPHSDDVVNLFRLLHSSRTDRCLLYRFGEVEPNDYFVDNTNTLSYQHIHVIIRDNAHFMDTAVGNISYEVSIYKTQFIFKTYFIS